MSEDAGGISGPNVIVVSGTVASSYQPGQVEQVKQRVQDGAVLILFLDGDTTVLETWGPFLPALPEERGKSVSGTAVAGDNYPLRDRFKDTVVSSAVAIRARANAHIAVSLKDGTPLVCFRDYGRGVVVVSAVPADTLPKQFVEGFGAWCAARAARHKTFAEQASAMAGEHTHETRSLAAACVADGVFEPFLYAAASRVKEYWDRWGARYVRDDEHAFSDYPYLCLDNMRLYAAFKVGEDSTVYELRLTGWDKPYYRQYQLTDYHVHLRDVADGHVIRLSRDTVVEYGQESYLPIIRARYQSEGISVMETLFLPPESDVLVRSFEVQNISATERRLMLEASLTPSIDLDPSDEVPGWEVPPDWRENRVEILTDAVRAFRTLCETFTRTIDGDPITGPRAPVTYRVDDTLSLVMAASVPLATHRLEHATDTTPASLMASWNLGSISPGSTVRISVFLSPTTGDAQACAHALRTTDASRELERTRSWWRSYVGSLQTVVTPDPLLNYLYLRSIVYGKMHHKPACIIAAIRFYLYCWIRDSSEISRVFTRLGDRSLAQTHFSFHQRTQDPAGFWWAHSYTNGIPSWDILEMCEPPYAATSLWEYYRRTKDLDTVRTYYPMAKKAIEFMLGESAKNDDRLIFALNDDDHTGPETHGKWFYMNAHTVVGLERLADLARLLGKGEDAARFAREGRTLREAVEKEFRDAAHGTWFSVKRRDGTREYPEGGFRTTQLATVLVRDYVPITDPVATTSFEATFGETLRDPFTVATQLRLPEFLLRRNGAGDVDAAVDLMYNDLDAAFNEFGRSYIADCVDFLGEIGGPAPRPDLQPLPQGWSHTFFLLSMLELAGVGYDAQHDAVVFRPVLPQGRTRSGHRFRPDGLCRVPRYAVDWSYLGVRNVPVPLGGLVHAYYRAALTEGDVVVDLRGYTGERLNLVFVNTAVREQRLTVRVIGGDGPTMVTVPPHGEMRCVVTKAR